VIYGLGNLISNAVDFALSKVEIRATWSGREVAVTIADDGPGISPLVLDALGEPYVTTRPARHPDRARDGEPAGMGLGFFIAKTLLERSGATVSLENRPAPASGAIVKVSWPRADFESTETAGHGPAEREPEPAATGRG
jgi:two-component system sensor histidine kinase RegB